MFGEIHLCQFPFTSGVASKIRPALILFDFGNDAVICRVTSAAKSRPFDVPIQAWRQAGLLKPSIARIDRLVTAERSIFLRRLGSLETNDLAAVRLAWNQQMRL